MTADIMAVALPLPKHGIGIRIPGDTPLDEAWRREDNPLDWQVALCAMDTVEDLAVPNHWAVVKTTPGEKRVLGVVGDGYRVVQNRELKAILDSIGKPEEIALESMGQLQGGRRVWIQVTLPDHCWAVPKNDEIQYVLITNTYDGSGGLGVYATPTYVACGETLQAALETAQAGLCVRHTRNVVRVVKERIHDVLGLVRRAHDTE